MASEAIIGVASRGAGSAGIGRWWLVMAAVGFPAFDLIAVPIALDASAPSLEVYLVIVEADAVPVGDALAVGARRQPRVIASIRLPAFGWVAEPVSLNASVRGLAAVAVGVVAAAVPVDALIVVCATVWVPTIDPAEPVVGDASAIVYGSGAVTVCADARVGYLVTRLAQRGGEEVAGPSYPDPTGHWASLRGEAVAARITLVRCGPLLGAGRDSACGRVFGPVLPGRAATPGKERNGNASDEQSSRSHLGATHGTGS